MLVGGHVVIVHYTDHQLVAQGTGLVQQIDVARMKQIAAHIGIDT
jgi:hypothetical protein